MQEPLKIIRRTNEIMNDYVLQLLQNGSHCNEKGISFALQQAYHHFGLERFIQSVTNIQITNDIEDVLNEK